MNVRPGAVVLWLDGVPGLALRADVDSVTLAGFHPRSRGVFLLERSASEIDRAHQRGTLKSVSLEAS